MGHLLDLSLAPLLSVRFFVNLPCHGTRMLSSRLFGIIKMLLLDSARYLKKDLFSKGIITIGDLLSDARIFLKGVKALNANLSPIEYFSLMSIVDAIPFEQAV